ncbi:MAG: PA0069 family radical SAM protein [Ignavibacteria bacterium]|nr:PA0069 family radical SAM protein [Ignavibacteria bacterium]
MRGRAAAENPPNRFERLSVEPLSTDLEHEDSPHSVPTVFLRDTSRSILAKNESPDVPFDFSVNPYRGCEHGCIYCYARPSHEYLGFSAGLDFETRIMVKTDAPRLLDEALSRRSWKPQVVALSGNTDCYQPVERTLSLTRGCLEIFLQHRNPVSVITKNSLVLRDADILGEMASMHLVHVTLSITTLDSELVRVMEPRTASPRKRLETLKNLARAGIPVGVNIAPVIPGLTDEEIPRILEAAAQHGATSAGFILLRLPGPVEGLFTHWLSNTLPHRAGKILNRIRETRGGNLSDSRFGSRLRGEGKLSSTIEQLFTLNASRYHLDGMEPPLSTELFRRSVTNQIDMNLS